MFRKFIIVGIAVLGAVACQPAPWSMPSRTCSTYFPQTGHGVQGPFCAYYWAQGGTESFGYPITDQFMQHGLEVQYFEKVRMEYHPGNSPPYQVQLGLLGETLARWEPPIPQFCAPAAFDASHRYYVATGHTLASPFLEYYNAHGGLDRFGYPLSEPYQLGRYTIQDFQRGRLLLQDGRMHIAPWGQMFLTAPERAPVPEDSRR